MPASPPRRDRSGYALTSPHTEEPQRHREDTEEDTEYFSTGPRGNHYVPTRPTGFRRADLPTIHPRKSFEFLVLSFELLAPCRRGDAPPPTCPPGVHSRRAAGAFTGGAWHPDMMLSSTSCRRAWHPLAAAPSRGSITDAATETGRAAGESPRAAGGHGDGDGHGDDKRKAPQMRGFSANNFPAATYSPTPQGCSTIGPEGLSCRVRNGIGRFPHGITTGKKSQPPPSHTKRANKESNKMWSSLTTD